RGLKAHGTGPATGSITEAIASAPWPGLAHGCPVEQVRLFVARPTQPGSPWPGLSRPSTPSFRSTERLAKTSVAGTNPAPGDQRLCISLPYRRVAATKP